MKKILVMSLVIALLLGLVPAAAAEQESAASAVTPARTDCELSIVSTSKKKTEKKTDEDEAEADTGTVVYQEDDPAVRLSDGNVMTRARFNYRQTLTATFSEGTEGIYLAFYDAPVNLTLVWQDSNGETVQQDTPSYGLLNQYFAVPEGAVSLFFDSEEEFILSDLLTFDSQTAPDYLPLSNPLPDSCDLLIIAAQTTDEQYDFAGVVPYYAKAGGFSCVQAFISSKNRQAEDDAILSLRSTGITAQPLFGGYKYRNYYEPAEKMVRTLWKDKELKNTIQYWIETCKPKVIITHEAGGEGGEALRDLTSKIVLQVVNDLKKTVPVSKVYLHTTGGSGTVLDFDSPLSGLAGSTAAEAANSAYNMYTCNAVYKRTVSAADTYQLAYTTVGQDVAANDLFENVAAEELTQGAGMPAVGAAETPQPEEEAEVPQEVSTPEPVAQEAPVEIAPVTTNDVIAAMTGNLPALLLRLLPILVGLIACIVLLIFRKPLVGIIVLVVGLAVGGLLLSMQFKETESNLNQAAIAAAATPIATPLPTPEPTPEDEIPEETAAEETAPAEEDLAATEKKQETHPEWDEYFRAETDPEEVVVFDYENGKYEYRTDDLSILIDRRLTELPLTYYVAHIRMRNVDAFRPGFGTDAETGSTKCAAWEMARRYKAVLLITGDDMTHMEQDLKGIILRNGTYYSADDNEATMAMTPGMSMRIFRQGSTTVDDLFDLGVENTFAFGPTLVENGEVYKKAYKHRVRADNPRVGVGMIEPGHFVVIVADGRLKDVSLGMPIMEFAELFKTEGCQQAFNMDGGASAAMVFMGEFINMRNSEHVRTMPDGLMWGYSEQVPSLSDPLVYSGEQE